ATQAEEYLGKPDTQNIPVESQQSLEEQKILQEAKDPKNQVPVTPQENKESAPGNKEKKKNNLFQRVFGKKK
ncbi:MAG: hypothetical protein ACKO6K_07625, partial [Chitinophagaceae bacterium]